MNDIKLDRVEENSSKLILKAKEIDINERLKEIQKQIDIENSEIENIENDINKYEKKSLNPINEYIFLNNKAYNTLLKSNFLITGLPDEILNNKTINTNTEILNLINKGNKKKALNQIKSASSLTTINTDNNNNIRYNILHKNYSGLKQNKVILNPELFTERKKEEEKLKILMNLRNKELIKIQSPKSRIKDMMTNLSNSKIKNSFSVKSLRNKQKKYLYMTAEENEKEKQMEEEFLISLENEKRRMKYSPISSDEINKFSKEVKNNQNILKAESEIKKLKLNLLWKERKKLLPDYKSKFQIMNNKEDEEKKYYDVFKKEQIKKDINNKKNFAEVVFRNFQPRIINDKLKTEREEKIKELNGIGRIKNIKNLGKKLKIIQNKIHNSQPKNFKTNNKIKIEDIIYKKIPLPHPVDYLAEFRILKEKKQLNEQKRNNSNDKIYKYNNKINNYDNKDLYNNIINVKIESKILQDKAKNKKILLKYAKHPINDDNFDKFNEISQLYYDSIQAKLKILNHFNKIKK